jgi:hypothetical protein
MATEQEIKALGKNPIYHAPTDSFYAEGDSPPPVIKRETQPLSSEPPLEIVEELFKPVVVEEKQPEPVIEMESAISPLLEEKAEPIAEEVALPAPKRGSKR